MSQENGKSGWYMRATGFSIRRGAVKESREFRADECCKECFDKVCDAIMYVANAKEQP